MWVVARTKSNYHLTNTWIQTVLNHQTASSLGSLPSEILLKITSELAYVGYVELSRTCKKLRLGMEIRAPPDKDAWYKINSTDSQPLGRHLITCIDKRRWYHLCPGCFEYVEVSSFLDTQDPASYLRCSSPDNTIGRRHSYHHLRLRRELIEIRFYCQHRDVKYVAWSCICRRCQWRLDGRKEPVRERKASIAKFRVRAIKRLK